MNDARARPAGPHDMGGLEGGPIDQSEHQITFWEWRVDAMVRLLLKAGLIVDFAELRRAIETLGPEAYDGLSYYERWTAAVATLMVEKGVVSQDQLDAKIAALKAAQSGEGAATS